MLALVVTLILTVNEVLSLKLREVSVPAVVMRGDPVQLGCNFELEPGDTLYSVKWHKDGLEFYRYLPDNHPASQKYPVDGIYLELYHAREGQVSMSKTDVSSEGMYRCEVSTDAPNFQTVSGEGEMRIYVYPSEGPRIVGNKLQYGIGEDINVTCVAAPSRPAAFLKWFRNGKEVHVDSLTRYDPTETEDGLLISRLGLSFRAEISHFVDYFANDERIAAMKLHCEAIISQAHTLTSEEILVSQNATLNDYDRSSVRTFSSIPFESGPTITGGRPHYRVSEEVNVNCTGPRSQPPAELHWYMNDKEVRQEFLVQYPPVRYADGQEAYVLGLRFIVKQRYFPNGQPMRLRCTAAALSEVVKMSSPTVQVLNRNQRQQMSGLHVYEKSLAVSGSADKKHVTIYCLWNILLSVLYVTVL